MADTLTGLVETLKNVATLTTESASLPETSNEVTTKTEEISSAEEAPASEI